MNFSESVRNQIFMVIKENPGILRTEVRDQLGLQNNVSGPAIKDLIDRGMVVEGSPRVSKTTGKPGKTLYVSGAWKTELDSQNKVFE